MSDLDNPPLIGSKGSDRVVSDDKIDFCNCSSIMSEEECVHQLRFQKKRNTKYGRSKTSNEQTNTRS